MKSPASLVPALGWLARYPREALGPDTIAGLTAAAVVIPKAMAFATIAGLPVQVGLYTACIPLVAYAALGSSFTLSVSTTTTIAILGAAALADLPAGTAPAAAVATLGILVGLILLAARLLRLGFVANFISDPVLTGFKTGIGLVIVVDQLPKLLGIHIHKSGFLRDLWSIGAELGAVSVATLGVALASFAVIVVLHRLLPRAPAPLLVVALAIACSLLFGLEAHGVAVVGAIPAGLPAPVLPERALLAGMWAPAAGIALMSFTESIAAGRAFQRRGEPRIDSDQELLALGGANIAGALLGAMPSGGGTSQTAVNASAGARTQVAGLVTAAASLATMLFLAPALGALPYATLAAVVVAYSMPLIDPGEILAIRRVRLTEFRWALAAVLGVVLLGTLKGILVAVILSLGSLMHQANHPYVYAVRRRSGSSDFEALADSEAPRLALPGLLIARIEGRVYFANAQTIAERLRVLVDATQPRVLLVDGRAILDFEYTALKALVDWEAALRAQGVEVWFAALNPSALAQLRQTTLADTLGEARLFPSLHGAVAAYESRGG